MTHRVSMLLNQLFSGGIVSLWGAIAVSASVFGTLWGLGNAAGLEGGPVTLGLLLVLAILPALGLFGLRPIRWAIVAWILRTNIRPLETYRPQLIIGLGPGGAIIAGMIAKILADAQREEPLVYVIDRRFKWEGKTLAVSLSEAISGEASATPDATSKRVLLATSEVHTGNTIRMASEYLDQIGMEHKTFSFIASPSAGFQVDYTVIESDKRGLLPWQDAPERERKE